MCKYTYFVFFCRIIFYNNIGCLNGNLLAFKAITEKYIKFRVAKQRANCYLLESESKLPTKLLRKLVISRDYTSFNSYRIR